MTKLLQNRIAESKLAMPVVFAYSMGIWLVYGLLHEFYLASFGCFAVAAILMSQLNNINALIRIYTRMVSCTFMVLTCCACFLIPSVHMFIMEICFISAMIFLFFTYEDKESVGYTFYAFLFYGLASTFYAQILFYLPLIWLFTATNLLSLSWRTWGASMIGFLTPYWFVAGALTLTGGDYTILIAHFARVANIQMPFDFSVLSTSQMVFYAFLCGLSVLGIVHYIRKHHDDKIRIRLIYVLIIWTDVATALFLAFQPQHFNCFIRIMIITTAPLIAHFIALTHTKVTNIAFCVLTGLTLLLTGYNLWMSLSPS